MKTYNRKSFGGYFFILLLFIGAFIMTGACAVRAEDLKEIETDAGEGLIKFAQMAEHDGRLYACVWQGSQGVYCLDPDSGEFQKVLSYEKQDAANMCLAISDEYIYVKVTTQNEENRIMQYTMDGKFVGDVCRENMYTETPGYIYNGYLYYVKIHELVRRELRAGSSEEILMEDENFWGNFGIQDDVIYCVCLPDAVQELVKMKPDGSGQEVLGLLEDVGQVIFARMDIDEIYKDQDYVMMRNQAGMPDRLACYDPVGGQVEELFSIEPNYFASSIFDGNKFIYEIEDSENTSGIWMYDRDTGENICIAEALSGERGVYSLKKVSGQTKIYFMASETYALWSINYDGSDAVQLYNGNIFDGGL